MGGGCVFVNLKIREDRWRLFFHDPEHLESNASYFPLSVPGAPEAENMPKLAEVRRQYDLTLGGIRQHEPCILILDAHFLKRSVSVFSPLWEILSPPRAA